MDDMFHSVPPPRISLGYTVDYQVQFPSRIAGYVFQQELGSLQSQINKEGKRSKEETSILWALPQFIEGEEQKKNREKKKWKKKKENKKQKTKNKKYKHHWLICVNWRQFD